MRALLLLALALPTAAALDSFPAESQLGATEARFLLRVQDDGPVMLTADAPGALAALVAPGDEPAQWARLPATLTPSVGEWHGLQGVTELRLRRENASQALVLSASDGSGAGVLLEWPAAEALATQGARHETPDAGAAAALMAVGALAYGRRRRLA